MTFPNQPSYSLPRGFIPVMLTPFRESGAIDSPGLAHLTDYYLASGAAGLFANCLSSEMYELTDAERLAITRQVVKQADGRVPVVATGTFGGPIEQQADFVKRIYDTGVQAVIVITSHLAGEDEDDVVFLDRMNQLMALTDTIPLGFYECPVPYKRLTNSNVLAELLPTGRLVYHKDTCLDANEVSRRLAVAKGYTFALYDAYMVNAVSSLRAGVAGLSCIQGNYFPELISWLCGHYNDGSKEVDKVQQFFAQNMGVMHDTYPASAKYILEKRGLDIPQICRNGSKLRNTTEYDRLDTLFNQFKELAQEINLNMISL